MVVIIAKTFNCFLGITHSNAKNLACIFNRKVLHASKHPISDSIFSTKIVCDDYNEVALFGGCSRLESRSRKAFAIAQQKR